MMRLIVTAILSFSCLCALSQTIEVAVQKGHSGDINTIAFNSNSTLLASAGADNLIKLWHVPTGKEMASFISASGKPVMALQFSEDDSFLYVKYSENVVHIWDIAKSALLPTTPSSISFPETNRYQSIDGKYEVTIDRFYLKKRNSQNRKVVFSRVPIDIAKNFTSVAVSEINNLLVASNEDGNVYAFDWSTGKSRGILEGHYTSVNHVCFSPDGTLLASASSDRSILLWDAKTRKQVRRLFGRSFRFESVAFNHKGTQLAVGDELGKGRIIDLFSTRVKVTVADWHGQKVSDLAFSPNDSLVYSGGHDNRLICHSTTTKELSSTTYKNYFSAGDFLLKVFNAYREPFAWVNAVSVSPSGGSVAIGGSWRESVPRKRAEPILIKNTHTGKIDKLLSHQGGVDDICFINESNFVSAHGNMLLNWHYNADDDKYYFRKIIFPSVERVNRVVIGPNNTLLLQADSIILHYDLKKETILDSIHTHGEITYLACDPKNGHVAFSLSNTLVFTSLDSWHQKKTIIPQAHSDRISGIDFSPSAPIVATVSWDATIKLWDLESTTLKATIISVGPDDHIIITPDNYYYGTRNSLRGIGFKYGSQFISPEQFDLRFNRPDIVLDRLGFVPKHVVISFNRAYRKRLQKMNFTEEKLGEDIHLPEVSVSSKNSVSVSNPQFLLKINASDTKYLLDRLNVFINNVPVYGLQGIDLRSKNTQHTEENIELQLSAGRNKIQVSCLNEKGVESLLQTIEVNYSPASALRPTLYLAVISVSDYQNPVMNLKYAAKDGRDIIKMFSQTGWFDKVIVDSLLNSNATKENILKLRDKFMKASIQDHVILYVSGHGLLDENLDFYFATHDIDFKNPAERGVRYDDLENLLDGIPARNKLLLMDACHSGEVDKASLQASNKQIQDKNVRGTIKTYSYPADIAEEHYQVGIKTSFELMQEIFANLSKGSGAVVISAAAGNSYALESDEWQNGVFTFSLLNGLKSKASDANRNGQITVSELKDYISKEVERLTDGAQKPTSRRENLEFDFRIY